MGSETLAEARLRRQGELESRSSDYEELYGIMRTRPEQEVAAIVSRIRAGADVKDVVQSVKDGDILIQLPTAPEAE